MSRFFLVDAPPLDPGVCWITKTSKGPFIDTGVDLSKTVIDRGRIYLSVDVLREMAQIAGLFDEGEPKTAGLKKKQWYEEGYQAAVKELQNDVVNNFVERVISNTALTAGAAVSPAPESSGQTVAEPGTIDEGPTGNTVQSNTDSDEPERKSAGVSRFKRPARLSAGSSDESTYRL
jgi:hypothetical protein